MADCHSEDKAWRRLIGIAKEKGSPSFSVPLWTGNREWSSDWSQLFSTEQKPFLTYIWLKFPKQFS
jgi:hypothetical protein